MQTFDTPTVLDPAMAAISVGSVGSSGVVVIGGIVAVVAIAVGLASVVGRLGYLETRTGKTDISEAGKLFIAATVLSCVASLLGVVALVCYYTRTFDYKIVAVAGSLLVAIAGALALGATSKMCGSDPVCDHTSKTIARVFASVAIATFPIALALFTGDKYTHRRLGGVELVERGSNFEDNNAWVGSRPTSSQDALDSRTAPRGLLNGDAARSLTATCSANPDHASCSDATQRSGELPTLPIDQQLNNDIPTIVNGDNTMIFHRLAGWVSREELAATFDTFNLVYNTIGGYPIKGLPNLEANYEKTKNPCQRSTTVQTGQVIIGGMSTTTEQTYVYVSLAINGSECSGDQLYVYSPLTEQWDWMGPGEEFPQYLESIEYY